MARSNKNSGGKQPMTPKAAARIQSAADRRGGDGDFKARATSAAAKNSGSNPAGTPAQGPKPSEK